MTLATVRDMLDETLSRLEDAREEGDHYRSLCPKCDAPERTCVVKAFDDGLGFKCESPPGRGCSAGEILAAIELRPEDVTLEDIGVPGFSSAEVIPDGSELLRKLAAYVQRYVVLTNEQADLVALWVVHTHALDAADTTPYLEVVSAEKRSGKTRLLEGLSTVAAKSWFTGRVTAAVLVRKVADLRPTLLLDESDAAFKGDKEYSEALRGILNSGFRRGGVASLCVGQGASLAYADFHVFSPKVIAGIGKLPDTISDRAIKIELRRRARSESVERFRLRKVEPEAEMLKAEAAAWAGAHIDRLAKLEPPLPDELDDRAQEICEPLLAVAEVAGGDWLERARRALIALAGASARGRA